VFLIVQAAMYAWNAQYPDPAMVQAHGAPARRLHRGSLYLVAVSTT
jgi:hypothetical protein